MKIIHLNHPTKTLTNLIKVKQLTIGQEQKYEGKICQETF